MGEAFVAVLGGDALEDFAAELLLVGLEVADAGLDDGPVVADLLAQGVIEGEAELLLLVVREALVEAGDGGFGGGFGGGADGGVGGEDAASRQERGRRGRGRRDSETPDKLSTGEGRAAFRTLGHG